MLSWHLPGSVLCAGRTAVASDGVTVVGIVRTGVSNRLTRLLSHLLLDTSALPAHQLDMLRRGRVLRIHLILELVLYRLLLFPRLRSGIRSLQTVSVPVLHQRVQFALCTHCFVAVGFVTDFVHVQLIVFFRFFLDLLFYLQDFR